ncbi:MAG: endonuclease/exonuclease/phosphatase family protein [Gammaproteobacteria bacterium]|nr:endonuclease/exonuclease/phosphatase family protein [Gammaproteobacteria bacterium]
MNYTKLRYDPFFKKNKTTTRRVIDRLRALREWLPAPQNEGGGGVPDKHSDCCLLLATWNIRDFGKDKGFGPRTLEPIYYMAEIISAFDLVALQEITSDMRQFKDIMRILGPDWDYIATDVTGNQERMVFVYDTRKVKFRSIVGEVTLLEHELIRLSQTVKMPKKASLTDKDGNPVPLPAGASLALPKGNKLLTGKQFNRTPFMVSFQAGWFKFNLCTVHMYFGKGKAGVEQRRQEIEKVAKVFKKRAAKERKEARDRGLDDSSLETYIVLGDFNILAPNKTTGESETLNALLDNGFGMHEKLRNTPTNMFKTEHYDQIAVLKRHGKIRMKQSQAGVLDFYQQIYRASVDDVKVRKKKSGEEFPAADSSDFDAYFKEMGASKLRDTHDKKRTFVGDVKVNKGDPRTKDQIREWYATCWRTYHMSDHLPMWMALDIDFSDDYLTKVDAEIG